jgi:hypothetical protein
MCQKASGGPFMAFGGVPMGELVWTRGLPKIFASSDVAERGFCPECGTPLTYRFLERDRVAVTIGSLDRPAALAPEIQYCGESKLPWLDSIFSLPTRDIQGLLGADIDIGSRQHPDDDT